MIEYPYIGNALLFFFIVSLIGYALYNITRRKGKPEPGKEIIYACGEDMQPEELNIPPETFYEYLIDLFRVKKLRRLHSGVLNDYLLWVLAGTLAAIAALMIFG